MTRKLNGCAAIALWLALTGCDRDPPTLYTNLGGPVYDFRLAVDATATTSLPGGTITTFTRTGPVLDSIRLALRGLPQVTSGYTIFSVDSATRTTVAARTGVTPAANGTVTVTIPAAAFGTGNWVVVGFGGADLAAASLPLFFQFRNPTTGAYAATGTLALGQYSEVATANSRRFVFPSATRWGRGGLWMDMPAEGDIWLRGYVTNVPLAPNGYRYVAWALDLAGDTVRAASRLGELTDSTGAAFSSHETAPAGAPTSADLGKAFFDATQTVLGVNLLTFTNLYVTLEPAGVTTTTPGPSVLYKATFPRQFTLRRPTS
jgi:hypothetical protein